MRGFSRLNKFLESQSSTKIILLGVSIAGLLGIVDFWSGFELSFSLFYLAPVSLAAWYLGRNAGIAMSTFCAVLWEFANLLAGESFALLLLPIWNTLTRLVIFLIVTFLLSELRKRLEHERMLSRTDFLTGVFNGRAFYDLAEAELSRMRRYQHPLTAIYIDLDNFKAINDKMGHSAGDELLRSIANTVRSCLRTNDYIARLGGDEFVILLVETDQDRAPMFVQRLLSTLDSNLTVAGWEISFSLGVLTCNLPPETVDELIRIVDQLMYCKKNGGKNGVCYATFPEDYAQPA